VALHRRFERRGIAPDRELGLALPVELGADHDGGRFGSRIPQCVVEQVDEQPAQVVRAEGHPRQRCCGLQQQRSAQPLWACQSAQQLATVASSDT